MTLAEDRYLTYPHCHGFLPDGGVVLGHRDRPALSRLSLSRLASGAGEQAEILALEPATGPAAATAVLWFDIARDTGLLAAAWNDRVVVVDATAAEPRPRTVHRAAQGWTLDNLVSIDRAGTRILLVERDGTERHRGYELDLQTGELVMLFEHDWYANHIQFCPADEDWRGYAHEGVATTITDRVWGWHAEQAPQGRMLVDQEQLGLESPVAIGHERWMWHRAGLVAIAYGEGPPRHGVVEAFPDGTARIVSEGARDWHVNISQDGRWAVVDTSGPADRPGRGWEDAGDVSDILLVDMTSGSRRHLARTRHLDHPYHPHPTFTPDGTAVLYNAVEIEAGGVRRLGVTSVAVDGGT